MRCRALLDQALAGQGLAPGGVFDSFLGTAAIGIAPAGRKLAYATPDAVDVYDLDAVFEARAARLPQGDFKIGVSVPGRVSGKPYALELVVSRRRDALRWVRTLEPCLGPKLKVDSLG